MGDDDPLANVVFGCLAGVAITLALPVLAVGGAAVAVGRVLARGGGRALERSRTRRELQRVAQERNEAIRDIVAIRHRAEREMREAAEDSRGGEW
jgi:hypothetical protein